MNPIRTALLATVVAGGLASVSRLAKGETPTVRMGVGTLGLGIFLTAVAEMVPRLGNAVSLLVLVSAIFVYSGSAFEAISKAVK